VTYGQTATFEEAAESNLDERHDVIPWLKALARFAADQHEVRMFYFHPPGVRLYEHALAAMTAQAQALQGRFHWYTMAGLSRFLDRRETATWSVERRDDHARVTAQSPDSLKDLTWLIPAGRYARPSIVDGEAKVGRDGPDWTVAATEGRRLVIDLALVNQKTAHSAPNSHSRNHRLIASASPVGRLSSVPGAFESNEHCVVAVAPLICLDQVGAFQSH
jgi:hypothetical protein